MRSHRAFIAPGLLLAASTLGTGCFDSAAANLGDHTIVRLPDGRVQVDLDVIGAEQGGGAVGGYCVYTYWFSPGLDLNTVRADITYYGPLDVARVCANDVPAEPLRDGDRRRHRLISNRFDIPPGAPMRLQVSLGSNYDIENEFAP